MALTPSDLAWLRCFECAARTGSFTEAARELNLSQSAISQQIRSLEQRLDRALFVRKARGLELTALGVQLKDELGQSMRQIESALANALDQKHTLNVGCVPTFALRWLMPRIGRFLQRHPEIEFRLNADNAAVDEPFLNAQQGDVLITYDPSDYPGVHQVRLMGSHIVPVCAPGYLAEHPDWASDPEVTLLHDENAWGGAARHVEWNIWREGVGLAPLGAHRSQVFNLSDMAIAAAARGAGVAMGRVELIGEDLAKGTLVEAAPQRVRSLSRYALLAHQPRKHSVALFTSWIVEECRALGG
ncbi:LysR substrate-binding domain-containing protein [Novosphingobium sp. 1949]|uniref:LysR substrate-binding domain-containing protein n=1 Tax=Novosphingobium organovorum TaxID=2930092 RepID=A0ABT0BJ59_9SPHN|nr:LysR substrate-binding domain-containing protein [Novosphingobium organovorum]MCJ2184878.1 LysR substrate-binding domain-containing protein [Novosphingobium organovorum]